MTGIRDATYPLVCERPRPGRPDNLCALPACDPAQNYDFRMFGHLYRVRSNAQNIATAQQACVAWGGHLVVFDTPEEREMVVRFGPSTKFWIGLYRPEDGDWIWVDGVTPEQRPIPWSSAEVRDTDMAAALAPTGGHDTHLVVSATGLAELPYVCRKDLPPGDAGK